MRIVFIGDIMGRSGREALELHLHGLVKEMEAEVVIVNGENAAHGKGITKKIAEDMFAMGVDCITTGNHIWDQREIIPYLDREPRLLRPLNFPSGTVGNGSYICALKDGRKILIVNAMARLFMETLDCPFQGMRQVLETYKLGHNIDAIFVDFHGETTSEKMSFGHYFSGHVSAIVGTHTHVPTADAHIMAGGTGYQTDAGMTGDYDSVIGVRKDIAIHRFVRKTPHTDKMIPANGEGTLCGTFIETDDRTGLAIDIKPIRKGGLLKGA